ncbi:DUF4124 domain-containing protein [Pseudoalteromonas lipolytica]|uniref:DUF4124 domain-containing protein n=1 Tax=Pseudoalteromonas lipolytica TaxID=570156 RepID=UPI00241E0CB5|nr:DUF4124 domain-containing protein [Pseudoalteromonas lipolytica]|tara:strand:+ start:1844 stop:2317 length:474 start_codon:yes stop_codon:yes gene_type:complete
MKATITALFSSLFITFSPALTAAEYYKCVTDKGTVFSQFPCGNRATKHRITVTDPDIQAPDNYVKQLNELEREQIIKRLEAEIRSQKHRLDILSRERDRAQYQQEQRLNRILSDSQSNQISKDIQKQLNSINKQYQRDVNKANKKLANLEKKLARYN